MNNENRVLNLKTIFIFWYPLAATWLMMACENPFLTAIIARLDAPKYNLAAFGVAFSFALIVEAPIIMLMSASTALAKDRDSYLKLRRFTFVLNSGITVLMLVTLFPPVFFWLTEGLMRLPENIVRLTHTALLLLLPWPAAIGFRRFYQGLLIRNNLTRRVAYGAVVRLSAMAVSASILYSFKVKGAFVGAAALSTGVVFEAVASRVMAHNTVKSIIKKSDIIEQKNNNSLTYGFIIRFYYPLALMSILSLGIHPIVTFFMGMSRFPIESLAVLPVVNALVFVFRSLGLSYQEVGIALMGGQNEKYVPVRNFALLLCAFVTTGTALIVFTPLAEIWFVQVSGLSIELSGFSYLPAKILVLLPALSVWISYQRSLLVNIHRTAPISRATLIEVILIALCLVIFIKYLDIVGAVAATLAYILGRLGANFYLLRHQSLAEKH
jgi:hypothetical protein